MKELKKYAATGITEEELAFTKSAMGPLRYETGNQKAGFIDRILTCNMQRNFVETQNKILAAIFKKDADAMAKKWLVTERIIFYWLVINQRSYPPCKNLVLKLWSWILTVTKSKKQQDIVRSKQV